MYLLSIKQTLEVSGGNPLSWEDTFWGSIGIGSAIALLGLTSSIFYFVTWGGAVTVNPIVGGGVNILMYHDLSLLWEGIGISLGLGIIAATSVFTLAVSTLDIE